MVTAAILTALLWALAGLAVLALLLAFNPGGHDGD
jgi:hypothetical protein